MFLSVIIDPFSFDDRRYTWVFQKNAYHSFMNGGAIISHERFSDYVDIWSEELKEQHQFRMLTEEEYGRLDKYFIPESIFNELIKEKGSVLGAKLYLLNHRYEPLETVLEEFIQDVLKKDTIEGIFNWVAHMKSVKYVANKYSIPLITSEFSLRFPNYRSLCFFCYGDIYQDEDIREKFNEFLERRNEINFRLFSRKELLAIFLDDSVVEYLRLYDAKPQYKVGVAGLHPIISTQFAHTQYTDLELIFDLRKHYKDDDLLFRKHPGEEPYQATYNFKHLDTHKSAIPFILSCERIAAQGSNIIFEAMLWGKGVYSHDFSPFAQFTEKDYSNPDPSAIGEEFLNFVLFSYFVPMEKVWDLEYLRWRNKKPSIIELFNYHLDIYLRERAIPENVLTYSPEERERFFLKTRDL